MKKEFVELRLENAVYSDVSKEAVLIVERWGGKYLDVGSWLVDVCHGDDVYYGLTLRVETCQNKNKTFERLNLSSLIGFEGCLTNDQLKLLRFRFKE